jgi:Flp pilus assembly protein TadB
LVFPPDLLTPAQLWLLAVGSLITALVVASTWVSVVVALVVAPLVMVVGLVGGLWMREQRVIAQIDATLPDAVGRLEIQVRGGLSLQQALRRVLVDMPVDHPLTREWRWMDQTIGATLPSGALATDADAVAALLEQTPSRVHQGFLRHLDMVLRDQTTHDKLLKRLAAAYTALKAAQQRRSKAQTELAQMKYSGVAISLAGSGMVLYLGLTQAERFQHAFRGVIGSIVGGIILLALLAPLVGGWVMAQVDLMDY